MIYFIIGASGSGKTTCLEPLKRLLPEFMFYDFDDIGVPNNADKKWRQEATEKWIKKLSQDYESKNACLLGQMVPAEIVSSPSAANLHDIYIILLDCSDEIRIQRLKKRNSYSIDQNTLNWASWLRMHCKNPTWEPHVIKNASSPQMCFEKWSSLKSWKDIANIKIIDTTKLSFYELAKQISKRIKLHIVKDLR